MEYLGVVLFGSILLTGAWCFGCAMVRNGRNEGSNHGGALDGSPSDVRWGF